MSLTESPISTVAPRRIDPARTFDNIVSWIAGYATQERAPGLIVGISGTDSILTFLACAEAFNHLGKPHRVLGLNFQHDTHNELADNKTGIQCVKTEFNWVARDILPWLAQQAPQAQFEIDSSIPHSDDNIRWGHLLSRAVRDTNPRAGLSSSHYFPVGTRNATEAALGTYSQISKSVSCLPIIDLYKSEVIEICQYLGVPQIAIDKSREIDCDCGRFDTLAHHMREVDLYIMSQKGLISTDYVRASMDQETYKSVMDLYWEEKSRNQFRNVTPEIPAESLVVTL